MKLNPSSLYALSYAELHCQTNYSFLTGASHADELIEVAEELGYPALAITDENTLAGVVRAFAAARGKSLKLVYGAELVMRDAPPLVVWASNRQGYANLCRLLTTGRRRAPKGECWLELNDVAEHAQGLLAGVIPMLPGDRSRTGHIDQQHVSFPWFSEPRNVTDDNHPRKLASSLAAVREIFADRVYLLAELFCGVDDAWRLQQLSDWSWRSHLPLLAAGDVLYHSPSRLPLHDVLTAIKHRTTVAEAGELLMPNAERHLHSLEQRCRQFAALPLAIQRTLEVVERCEFCLSQLRYEYPEELAPPGQTPLEFLVELTWQGAQQRYSHNIPEKVRALLRHELKLIEELRYEAYFLTVWDLVRFARSRQILCQGRGSAANSAVCYCLGITSVDPGTTELLFERFISKERDEAPDIDVDFEHERREEVLQYLYDKYGRERAGLAATVITYRSRSAIRDVGKALGLSLDRIDALTKQVDGYHNVADLAELMQTTGFEATSEIGQRLQHLATEILGFPRHLSQHVGGMVITRGRLDELVPIENAAMDDRTVIQWDKDDLEELGLLKVDCLCLGMLTAIRKCFAMVEQHWGRSYTLANIPQEDHRVYDMICAADTIGVFQIESRGQMSMLPRLKPRCWYDLVIEVAIVRPGPIQGNMVHPYLRRRAGEEQPVYPNPEIKAVLDRTLGVPIFQEQAMKLAVVAAGFTPGEADQLRRAMGAWRKTGVIEKFREKLMNGMRERGLSDEFAEQVFRQIRGFGEYGFPESHAASFARLAYVSAWLKYYYPAAFTAAILNSLPMGFYAPAQLISDAQRHGVQVLPVDVNESDWDNKLVPASQVDVNLGGQGVVGATGIHPYASPLPQPAIRLGLRQISGLPQTAAEQMLQVRQAAGPFTSMGDFARRTQLGQATIARFSKADAFASMRQDRREALWQALAQPAQPVVQPLFAELQETDDDLALLPVLSEEEQVFADYRHVGLSLRAHPISFYREKLTQLRVVTAADLVYQMNDSYLHTAGLVILRQRPSTAKGITFVTLEDETGTANLVVKPQIWERYRKITRAATAWLAYGKLEKRHGVIHVVVSRLQDLSAHLRDLNTKSRDFR
ncbi:MAG TPA: error-prone DNA polymerase [Pirellulaceae bacterium]|nr:error-prone DNA polymerase [Pirellulaceae bacterium]HMP69146.1 error-prone DNA polymerase [Pirellulaceae bacterium]